MEAWIKALVETDPFSGDHHLVVDVGGRPLTYCCRTVGRRCGRAAACYEYVSTVSQEELRLELSLGGDLAPSITRNSLCVPCRRALPPEECTLEEPIILCTRPLVSCHSYVPSPFMRTQKMEVYAGSHICSSSKVHYFSPLLFDVTSINSEIVLSNHNFKDSFIPTQFTINAPLCIFWSWTRPEDPI